MSKFALSRSSWRTENHRSNSLSSSCCGTDNHPRPRPEHRIRSWTFLSELSFQVSCTNVNRHVHCTGKSNPNSLVESLCPTLSVCRLILSDLSLHCNRHTNNSVRVMILRILMCSVSFCLECSVSWLIFSGVRGFVSLRDLLDVRAPL